MVKKFAYRESPDAEAVSFFNEHGFLYVTGFYDYDDEVKPIQEDIFKLIGLLAEQYKIPIGARRFTAETFDQGLPYMVEHHRDVVGLLYNAAKKLPNYIRLAASEKHDRYCRALLDTPFVGFANRGYGIRMDNPFEDQYSTQLHQDYVTQLCSQSGAVSWSPLRHVTAECGPVKFYPGSHRSGVFPIVKEQDGSRGLLMADAEELLARYAPLTTEVLVGDCLWMHILLIHESGQNRSNQARWSMLSRYFDFLDESGRAIGWRGGLQEDNSFEMIHPELTQILSLSERK